MAESARGTPPPEAIHVERKYVIEQVIAWRDGSEHFAHGTRSRFLICRALWFGADYRRFAGFGHALFLALCFLGFCFSRDGLLELNHNAFHLQYVVRIVSGEHAG